MDGRGSTEIARKQQRRRGITTAASIPARGTTDAYGDPFDGLPANRLAHRTLTEDEQADNSTTTRILDTREGSRAVSSAAAQDNFLLDRHVPANLVTARILKTDGPTDQRAVTSEAPRSGFLLARHFRGGDGANPNRLPDGVKVGLDNDTDGELPIGRTSGDMDGSRLARRSVASEKLAGVHGGKLFGRSSIPWSLIDVDGVVFWPGLKKYLDANYAKKARPISGGHRH